MSLWENSVMENRRQLKRLEEIKRKKKNEKQSTDSNGQR